MKFRSMSSTDASFFEHFNVLSKQSYRMISRWLLTRMRETVETMENEVCEERELEDEVQRRVCKAADPKKQQRMGRGQKYWVGNEICLSREEMVKNTTKGETGLSLENLHGRMMAELSGEEALQSLTEYARVCLGGR